MAFNLFADTNVLLDAYLQRTNEWIAADIIIKKAFAKEVTLFTSSSNLLNMI